MRQEAILLFPLLAQGRPKPFALVATTHSADES